MADLEHPRWQTGVFYIVYVRSFRDTTGDGVGDLADLVEKLDYLSDTLGVDAIWVAAVYPSKRDWYIWVDPKPDGSPPNNWLSVFGGSAWEWEGITNRFTTCRATATSIYARPRNGVC